MIDRPWPFPAPRLPPITLSVARGADHGTVTRLPIRHRGDLSAEIGRLAQAAAGWRAEP